MSGQLNHSLKYSFKLTDTFSNKNRWPTSSVGMPLSHERMYDSKRKLEIIIYKVLNMEIFLHKLIDLIKRPLLTPQSCVAYFFWWMDALYWTSNELEIYWSQQPFTAIIKLGRARTFLNITPIVFVWKKKVIYT